MKRYQITISEIDPKDIHVQPPKRFMTAQFTALTPVEARAKGSKLIREFIFKQEERKK